MKEISTVGPDRAKSVFQVPGFDAEGAVVVWRRVLLFFTRLQPCLIGMEACAGAQRRGVSW